ncbi:SDR family oxidoreductase [Pelomonas sp. SE-A7]|uniref:SDR family NAD(P)-dependent oxidoreductase n=1 Tax=Pelomonas sp. SE-A7 TaxID=3054953 RepID=UPI00259CE3D0|nr:SDR family oxidoreductase [Pelomonas sp. SE-A7]MDM4768345.1 SDR family oxidoreductase [Pelomonas sp. SE-A7]
MTTPSFNGRLAVITGAGSGIGRALALRLGAAGARLALSDIDPLGLAATLKQLPAGVEARAYSLDVSRRDAVFEHAEQVKREMGPAQLLINNAGVTVLGSIANTTIEEFEWQLGINLWGVIYGSKAFLPQMLEQGGGHIVNLSSLFGLATVPCQGAYHVSKFGVRGFTECLARELVDSGVKVSCVHPGGIATEIGHRARLVAAAGSLEQQMLERIPNLLKTPADAAAAAILDGVARGKRRILVGHKARTVDWLVRLLPSQYWRVLRAVEGL